MNNTHTNGSVFVVIIVTLAIAIIGVLGFVLWQNVTNNESVQVNTEKKSATAPVELNDPYEGWKLYSSSRDGYSIKYPSSWFFTPETEGDGPYIRNFDPNNNSDGPRDGQYSGYPLGAKYLRVLVDKNENGKKNASTMSTTEWYSALGNVDIQDSDSTSYSANEVRPLTISNFQAKSVKNAFTETNEAIYLLKGTDLYSIWIYPYGSSSDDETKLILDSFAYL